MKTWLERLFLALIFSLGFMQPALPVSGYQLPGTEFVFLIVAVVLAAAVTFKQVRLDPTQRLLAWQGSWDTFLDFPILGKGIGLGVANVQFLPPSVKCSC